MPGVKGVAQAIRRTPALLRQDSNLIPYPCTSWPLSLLSYGASLGVYLT